LATKRRVDEILVLRRHAGAALAAATLRPIGGERHALDVAGMRHGDDHVLAGDEVLVVHIGPPSVISVRRGVPNSSRIGDELVLDDVIMRRREDRMSR
jgi:hypothetical protein